MYSLMVLKTNEVDGIFPLPAKRPPGYNWLVSRVEIARWQAHSVAPISPQRRLSQEGFSQIWVSHKNTTQLRRQWDLGL
jgi:hypothetical protein